MVSIMEIMQLCRLCLVKEQVNIPIFEEQDDVRQICLKITSCLPVKITKEDKLPKKICDGCLYKLELLYQFYNTTANAEKQLLTWIEQINMDANEKNLENLAAQSTPPTVKQEKLEPVESTNENPDMSAEAQNYMLDQETFQPDFTFKESQGSTADAVDAAENSDEPLAKRPRRGRPRQATKPIPPESLDSSDNDNDNDDAGDSMLEMTVTKTEEESESEGEENVDDPEPTKFEAVGEDTEQPGPSGLGKGGADGPYLPDCFAPLLAPIVTIKEIESSSKNRRTIRKPTKKVDTSAQGDEAMPVHVNDIKSETHEVDNDEDPEKFKCRMCKCTLEMTLEEFKLHYKILHKDKRLPRIARANVGMHACDICAKNFKSVRNLNEHMETHNNQYDCEECNLSFKKVLHYTLHKRVHSIDDVFRCIFCDFSTDNVNDITSHLNIKHESNHRYVCKICNKGFDVLTWFKEHDNFHTNTKPFKCEYCGKNFMYSRYLSAHKNSMHKEEMTGVSSIHECVICKKQYQHRNSLKLHMNVHTGNFAICDICGKQLSSKEKLKFHLRIHTGYKPFKCSYCDKCFTKKPILVEHERIHTGERPYNCDYCHKAFSQRSSLVIHMRSHTGERPYVCHVCNKGFVARAMLNIHFKTCKGY